MPKGQNGEILKSHNSSRGSTDFHDWPLDSNFDSTRTIHSTSDLDDFMATLSVSMQPANAVMSRHMCRTQHDYMACRVIFFLASMSCATYKA